MRGAVGTPCVLAPFDMASDDEPPADGDYLLTEAGSAYLITEARRVRSRIHHHRWRLFCVRVTAADIPAGARVIGMHWYPRGRRR